MEVVDVDNDVDIEVQMDIMGIEIVKKEVFDNIVHLENKKIQEEKENIYEKRMKIYEVIEEDNLYPYNQEKVADFDS